MITFLLTPHAQALQRSQIQREILAQAARGHTDLSRIDWATLEHVVHTRLSPLQGAY